MNTRLWLDALVACVDPSLRWDDGSRWEAVRCAQAAFVEPRVLALPIARRWHADCGDPLANFNKETNR